MRKIISSSLVVLGLTAAANAQFCGSGAGFAIPDNNPAGASSTINVTNNFAITGIAVKINMSVNHSWIGDLIVTLTDPDGNTADLFRRVGVGIAGSTVGDSSNFAGGRFTTRGGVTNFADLNVPFPGCNATNISLAPFGTPAGNLWSASGVSGAPAPTGAPGTADNVFNGDYVASSNSGAGSTYADRYVEVNLMTLLAPGNSAGNWTLRISDNAGADTGTVASWQLQLLPEPTSLALVGLGVAALIRRRR